MRAQVTHTDGSKTTLAEDDDLDIFLTWYREAEPHEVYTLEAPGARTLVQKAHVVRIQVTA